MLQTQTENFYRPEAEGAILGSMIVDKDCIAAAMRAVSPDDFFVESHRTIFEGIVDLYLFGVFDLVLLRDWLKNRGKLDDIGGVEYLKRLADCVPASANLGYYARIVRGMAKERRLVEAVRAVSEIVNQPGELSEKIEAVQNLALSMDDSEARDIVFRVRDCAAEARRQLLNPDESALSTGFISLDNLIGGFLPGELIVPAARPSMGKTTFAMNIALSLAEDGKNILFFSLEMAAIDLVKRCLQKLGKVASGEINRKCVSEQQQKDLLNGETYLAGLDLSFIEASGITPAGLQAHIRAAGRKKPIDCVFVDYLQLMGCEVGTRASLYERTTEISKELKRIALSEKIPLVALCQLNRQAEQREHHRPRLSDLRDSGGIEQDADVVILLHSQDYYGRGDPKYKATGDINCIIAKNRRGACGDIELGFVPEIYTFADKANYE